MASVPLWGHKHFVPHNLIDLGLEVSEPKLRSKDAWLYFFGSISWFSLLGYLLDHILSFQIQISQVTKTEFIQGIFFFNAMILLGHFFGSASVFFFYI